MSIQEISGLGVFLTNLLARNVIWHVAAEKFEYGRLKKGDSNVVEFD